MEAQFPVAISPELLQEIALTPQEYTQIVQRLDREPNALELGLFGALWSEHCGYKHSKPLLRNLPSESPRLLAAPGAENAGVVDIGNGLALVVKIESHNHPSAVEPFHGAATGVGGIVRDPRRRPEAATCSTALSAGSHGTATASAYRTWEGRSSSLPPTPATRW